VAVSDVAIDRFSEAMVREFDHVAKAQGLEFSIEMSNTLPRTISTDPGRLHQVLKNLLANAFKFTAHGGVRVAIDRVGPGEAPRTLVDTPDVVAISVTDTGIGIAAGDQERVFEAFAQGDGTTARIYGGTGLGLSISRELVALIGGELTLRSELGKGSTFTVYLPLVQPTVDVVPAVLLDKRLGAPQPGVPANDWLAQRDVDSRAEQLVSHSVALSAVTGAHVLVVDDDYRNVFALSALLERGGAVVSIAESGSDALDILRRGPQIEVVLMDIMMPVMDGYATIRHIRQLEHCAALPIIAITGKVMAGERERCLEAGANDYIPKPVDAAELVAALTPWLPAKAAS
jgi:CheY-like chemotaxis protein